MDEHPDVLKRPLCLKLEAFVPRSRSAFVFTIVMACYNRMITSLLGGIVYLFHVRSSPLGYVAFNGSPIAGAILAVFFAPIIESCILIALIEFLRWVKTPAWVQIFIAAAVLAVPHSFSWGPHVLFAMPDFTIQAASYLYWRSSSWKKAFAVVACIHALHNLFPAMAAFGG